MLVNYGYLLLLHRNNGFVNSPHYYAISALSILCSNAIVCDEIAFDT